MNWSKLKDPQLVRDRALIDGQWVTAESGQRLDVRNPATGATIAQVASVGRGETEQAIAASYKAQRQWKQRTAHERADILRAYFDLIKFHAEDLAWIITSEQGKPLRESLGEVGYAAGFVQWFAEQAKRVNGDVLASPLVDKRLLVLRQPVGVCAAITPWNFPAAMITRKVAPALAAGCSMIVKPSELTPLTALALGELANRAGIPSGVLQVVTGDAKEIGETLTGSDQVRKLSFTGSTRVGKILAAQCVDTVKRVSLELGGHAPFIVFDDAQIDSAVAGAIASKYRNSGQTCICTNRFYVHSKVAMQFAEKLVEKTKQLRLGLGTDASTDLGPLINVQAVAKVEHHIADALYHGAELLCGGKRDSQGENFFQPTVLGRVNSSMLIAREETFGPVSAILEFDDEAEVIRQANDTDYGLAAYIFTKDIARVWRVAEALEYGMVGVNTGSISTEVAPFGGVKQSGLGREGSQVGIDEYLDIKYICLSLT